MGEEGGTAPNQLHEFEGLRERETDNRTTTHEDAKSNG